MEDKTQLNLSSVEDTFNRKLEDPFEHKPREYRRPKSYTSTSQTFDPFKKVDLFEETKPKYDSGSENELEDKTNSPIQEQEEHKSTNLPIQEQKEPKATNSPIQEQQEPKSPPRMPKKQQIPLEMQEKYEKPNDIENDASDEDDDMEFLKNYKLSSMLPIIQPKWIQHP
ncbi:unnamed protein product [Mytilus coruscus]|uniref:Uncharacterized protein n=1 Tax=Mytilus coruscus TaxID=42192 RepID=A0A6J8B5Y6_MYTCO|nr:unnamed protein product [Mytilus coruscus]